ncbi:hypothetical protein GcC1_095027 [Golovinomyces cichoracearum]|uniref:Uncharacterized protein n=1 Tax=Golovinomyces cichoracearum TaxID=62708 RepID=A0A420IC91_9PEZI|nr:hypothetical protein GcC1_095027 [Golovinomyces cichoracearum]
MANYYYNQKGLLIGIKLKEVEVVVGQVAVKGGNHAVANATIRAMIVAYVH